MYIQDFDARIADFRNEISRIVGGRGRFAYDEEAKILTIVPSRSLRAPIVLEFFEDGWVVLLTGAHVFFEVSPESGLPLVASLVAGIVDGYCEEYVLRDTINAWRICTAISLEDESYSQYPPKGKQIVKWRHSEWASNSTAPEVTPLCSYR
jgi:hypothetical protein